MPKGVQKPAVRREDTLAALAEVFREHGYAGASLALLGQATGLGKGSLYHFFPKGKEEMLAAVLAQIDGWFEVNVFAPLADKRDPARAIDAMFDSVDGYFRSGRRVCLVGVLAVGDVGDHFADPVRAYFARWIAALAAALARAGRSDADAAALAEEVVAGIQGAIVLSRALDDSGVFRRTLAKLQERSLRADRGS